MNLELRWLASRSASCLHAAEAVHHAFALADARLAATITELTAGLFAEIRGQALPGRFWDHLVGLSSSYTEAGELARLALIKTIGQRDDLDARAARLAEWIDELLDAVHQAIPRLLDQLELRGRPLQEQWEARGPGMLRRIVELTDPQILVPRADVVLVHPALGGGGAAHLPYNVVRLEAVLANPHDDLPEAVRLAWLVGQLNLDLPALSESVHADRLPLVAQLAMVPAALEAAQHVELVRDSGTSLPRALQCWRIATPVGVDPVDIVRRWWETYAATRPSFSVALAALDRMLQ